MLSAAAYSAVGTRGPSVPRWDSLEGRHVCNESRGRAQRRAARTGGIMPRTSTKLRQMPQTQPGGFCSRQSLIRFNFKCVPPHPGLYRHTSQREGLVLLSSRFDSFMFYSTPAFPPGELRAANQQPQLIRFWTSGQARSGRRDRALCSCKGWPSFHP